MVINLWGFFEHLQPYVFPFLSFLEKCHVYVNTFQNLIQLETILIYISDKWPNMGLLIAHCLCFIIVFSIPQEQLKNFNCQN